MNKVLLATTAVVGAVMFTQAALAEVKVTTGGYLEFAAGIFDNDLANNSGRDFRTEAELDFRAAGKADNGLEYSADVELQNDTDNGVGIDEAYLTLSGTWGRVELGDTDGAVRNMAVFAPTIGFNQIDDANDKGGANYSDYLGGTLAGVRAFNSDDSSKIAYYTPKWSGFQAGVSYAPEMDQGQNVVTSELGIPDDLATLLVDESLTALNYQDMWEAGVSFSHKYDQVGFLVGATLSTADAKEFGGVALLEDFTAWNLGLQVTWGGFTFGGGYTDNDEAFAIAGTDSDSNAWNLGVSYESGPWAVAASWLNAETEVGVLETDTDVFGVGTVYQVAPGLVVQGDMMFKNAETAGVDQDGWVLLLGTRMTF